jgi:ABC-2 type transport system permease protein
MTWLVARREIAQRGRSRVFAITTIIVLIAVALGVALPALLSQNSKPQRVGIAGGSTATLNSVVAEAGRIAGVKATVVPEPSTQAAETALRDGDLDVALVNGSEVIVKQVSINGASGGTLPGALAQVAGLAHLFEQVPAAAAAAAHGVALPVRGLEPPPGSLANRLTGLFTIVLLWILISAYGSQIAMGVGEEKGSRVAEVLLASIRPVQLLIGKVLGIGVLALAQAVGMVAVFFIAGHASGSSLTRGAPTGIVVTGGIFFVLGYAFYCTAYAAAGSLVSRQSDVNSVVFPVQIPLIVAYALSYTVIYANGASAFYRVLAFLPPTAPIAMPVLYAAGDVPVWQVVVSGVLCVAGTVWMARFAAGIYSRSILRTGGRVRLSQVLRREPAQAR